MRRDCPLWVQLQGTGLLVHTIEPLAWQVHVLQPSSLETVWPIMMFCPLWTQLHGLLVHVTWPLLWQVQVLQSEGLVSPILNVCPWYWHVHGLFSHCIAPVLLQVHELQESFCTISPILSSRPLWRHVIGQGLEVHVICPLAWHVQLLHRSFWTVSPMLSVLPSWEQPHASLVHTTWKQSDEGEEGKSGWSCKRRKLCV